MGQRYEKVLNSMGINVIFICDLIKPQKHKNYFKNFKAALSCSNVDGVIIATHGPSHFSILSYCLKKKIKYIVCEKPFTTSVTDADKIIKLNHQKTRLCVNYIRRFSKTYERILKYLYAENVIGKPRSVIITSGAGGIATLGIHYIDLISYLLNGNIISVFAIEINKNLPNPRGKQFVDPGGYFILNLDNESRAFIEMGDDLGLQPKIEIIGEYGRMVIDEFNNNILIRSRRKKDRLARRRLYGLSNPVTKNDSLNFESMEILMKNMLNNLISNKKIKSTELEGKKVVEVYSAIRKSFVTKKMVKLPLKGEFYKKEFMIT